MHIFSLFIFILFFYHHVLICLHQLSTKRGKVEVVSLGRRENRIFKVTKEILVSRHFQLLTRKMNFLGSRMFLEEICFTLFSSSPILFLIFFFYFFFVNMVKHFSFVWISYKQEWRVRIRERTLRWSETQATCCTILRVIIKIDDMINMSYLWGIIKSIHILWFEWNNKVT